MMVANAGNFFKTYAISTSCTGALHHSYGTDLGWLDQRVWPGGEPDLASLNGGCGHWCTNAFLFSISQTQGCNLLYSCFGDWVFLDCGPKDVYRAPHYTPPVPSVCSPHSSLETGQPLTPGQKPLWLSPYHSIYIYRLEYPTSQIK